MIVCVSKEPSGNLARRRNQGCYRKMMMRFYVEERCLVLGIGYGW